MSRVSRNDDAPTTTPHVSKEGGAAPHFHLPLAERRATDVSVIGAELYLLPIKTRVPLKFGAQTLSSVTCARVRLVIRDREERVAEGWGETPLSVPWTWPSNLSLEIRSAALEEFCRRLTHTWPHQGDFGHPIEIGDAFLRMTLPSIASRFNRVASLAEPMPHLAALVCCSAFDIALHDAYGNLVGRPVYETYGPEHMSRDLSRMLKPAEGSHVRFEGRYPSDYFEKPAKKRLPAWHLVGGLDPLTAQELETDTLQDGHPVLLSDWIERDGLQCLKVKLRGDDAAWDFQRLVLVGEIASKYGVEALTADFNCTVTEPDYVNRVLDRLRDDHPRLYDSILYVEQPFPCDLESNQIDAHSVSQRKPLLLDESAHDWTMVRLGRSLGWNGVALKTCKSQTGALLSLCWAKAHGMHVMVQDLTNPMLAQIPHVLLAAHAGTMLGVESNAMQFYPDVSAPESEVHPGLYRRVDGLLDLSSIQGTGFGYRLDEINRKLPRPSTTCFS